MINNNSYKRVLYLFLFLVYIGCSEVSPPVSFRDIKLTPKTDHEFNFDAYSIADGIFRGALWPDPDNPNFKVWLIKNGKEHFFPVSAPQRFVSWEKETTDYWNFTKGNKFDNKQKYQIEKKDKSIKFELNIPVKKSYPFTGNNRLILRFNTAA